MVQPTQDGVDQLLCKAEAARKLISGINDRYSHYKKDKGIGTMLKKLEYAIKTKSKKVEEMKEELLSKKEDDTEATSTEISIIKISRDASTAGIKSKYSNKIK